MTRLSIGGKSRKGVNRSQARSQVVTVWGHLIPMSDSEKSVRVCQAASWFGAVRACQVVCVCGVGYRWGLIRSG